MDLGAKGHLPGHWVMQGAEAEEGVSTLAVAVLLTPCKMLWQ
jgi:hypothetical protein